MEVPDSQQQSVRVATFPLLSFAAGILDFGWFYVTRYVVNSSGPTVAWWLVILPWALFVLRFVLPGLPSLMGAIFVFSHNHKCINVTPKMAFTASSQFFAVSYLCYLVFLGLFLLFVIFPLSVGGLMPG